MSRPELTLAAVLERAARDHAASVAYAFRGEELTFGALWEEAGALAAHLAASGVRPGDRVAIALHSNLDFVRFFWAVQRAGASSCAFNPFTPAATLVRRVLRMAPRLLIASDEPVIAESALQHLHVIAPGDARFAANVSAQVPAVPADASALAFLQPTSGTSGESRFVMIRHRNVLAFLESSASALSLTHDDVFVAWVPPWHDLGLVRFVIGNVYCGATCHIVPPAIHTISEWLRTIQQQRATVSGAPDFAWRLAADLVKDDLDLSSLRYATNGGEPVRMSTIERFEKRFGISGVIRPGYGLAEATLGVSTVLPGEALVADERGHVSCGTPFPGVEVTTAEDGEILVRGDGVFAGYFEAEEATNAALREGWLRTGDYGRVDDGGRLYVLGRKRAMIKRGGAVLAPRELEELALSVPGVRIAAAIGIASRSRGGTEEIALALEIDEAAAEANDTAAAVRTAVRRGLGFAPEHILVLPKHGVPRTYNGKVRHEELRRRLETEALQPSQPTPASR